MADHADLGFKPLTINPQASQQALAAHSDLGFKPSAPDVANKPDALSRFGTGLYNTTIGPFAETIQHPIEAAKGILNVPKLEEIARHIKEGNYGHAAAAILQYGAENPAVRMGKGMVDDVVHDAKEGNLAGAGGRILGDTIMLAGPKAGELAAGTKLGRAAGAGLRAAAPDMASGGAMIAGGEALAQVPGMSIPARIALGYPGAKQVGTGIKKGIAAGKQVYADASPAKEVALAKEVAAITPGEALAKAQGIDYAKLSAEDRAMLDLVAKGQANATAQPAVAPPQAPSRIAGNAGTDAGKNAGIAGNNAVQDAGNAGNAGIAPQPAAPSLSLAEQLQQEMAAQRAQQQPAAPAEVAAAPPVVAQVPESPGLRSPLRPPVDIRNMTRAQVDALPGAGEPSFADLTPAIQHQISKSILRAYGIDEGAISPEEIAATTREIVAHPGPARKVVSDFGGDTSLIGGSAPAPNSPSALAEALRASMAESGTLPVEQGGAPVPESRPSLAQQEAWMAQKGPPPTETPQSPYTASGERKSPELRGEEIKNANAAEKGKRIARALFDASITADQASKIEGGMVSETQLKQGMASRWGNISELLGEVEPKSSVPHIIHELRRLEAAAQKSQSANAK